MPFSASDSRVRNYPEAARSIWARAANSHLDRHPGEDANAIRIGWTALRNAGYGKQDHKWTYSGHWTPQELSKWNTWAPFEYGVTMVKAGKGPDGSSIEGIISGNQVDRQDEEMCISALKSIVAQLNTGKVLLLPSHADSFECGKSVSGELLKNGEPWDGDETELGDDDVVEVLAKFSLDEKHPLYDKIMEEYANKQFSVGGAVVSAYKEISKKTGTIVRKLRDVVLEHVAMTREKQAAYAPSKVTAAMAKNVNWDSEVIETVEGPDNEEGGGNMFKEAIAALKGAVDGLEKEGAGDGTVTLKDLESDGHGSFRIRKDAVSRMASKATKEERREVANLVVKALNAVGIMTVSEAPKVVLVQKSAKVAAAAPAAPAGSVPAAMETIIKEATKGLEKRLADVQVALEKAKADSAEARVLKENVAMLKTELEKVKAMPAAARPTGTGMPVEKTFQPGPTPDSGATGIVEKAVAKVAELTKEIVQGAQMLKSGQIQLNSKEHIDLQKKSDIKMELQANPVHAFQKHFGHELQKVS